MDVFIARNGTVATDIIGKVYDGVDEVEDPDVKSGLNLTVLPPLVDETVDDQTVRCILVRPRLREDELSVGMAHKGRECGREGNDGKRHIGGRHTLQIDR